jgi:hypothetical protein
VAGVERCFQVRKNYQAATERSIRASATEEENAFPLIDCIAVFFIV